MIVRIFSPIGNKRIDISDRDTLSNLYEKVENEFNTINIKLSLKPNGDDSIFKCTKLISTSGIKHGDIIYMKLSEDLKKSSTLENMEVDGDLTKVNIEHTGNFNKISHVEDDIDQFLTIQDGRIHRNRNEQYCRHGPSGKCIHCVPLEPYDEQYLEHCDPPIRFMSFHAYLRKLSGGAHQGKFTTLENINCKIKPGCKEHLPWPEGICTKCQPNAVTLNVQSYRHVDNIMFENKHLMDDFLDYWRKTGCQRIGIMFGYYTTFSQTPLGIKAVVSAIYEPQQKSTRKSVELTTLSDTSLLDPMIEEVAKLIGLRPVGWIFTDLVANDNKSAAQSIDSGGIVKHYRGTIDTYFLTAQECITSAYLQNLFPNKCNLSIDGQFGSKFVTVVVTGDAQNNIHFEGYQVSNQCMSLVRDEILVPTIDAPELGYIRESSSSQYVPDVFCGHTDSYGNTVTKIGRPLPVEFLLVHMSVAFPLDELHTLQYNSKKNITRFSVENRDNILEFQNLDSLKIYLNQFKDNQALALSNLHLIWYLFDPKNHLSIQQPLRIMLQSIQQYNSQSRMFSQTSTSSVNNTNQSQMIKPFLDCSVKNVKLIVNKFLQSPEWKTAEEILRSHSTPSGLNSTSVQNSEGATNHDNGVWSCIHCTYHNAFEFSSCQMCGLPQ